MRGCTVSVAFGLMAIVSVASAQTRAATSTPDLSGVWSRVGSSPGPGAARSLNPAETPSLTPWGAERFKAIRAGTDGPGDKGRDELDPVITSCAPAGPSRIFSFPRPFEIVQVPGRVLLLYEWDHWVRQVWTDGRPHPKDPDPSWMGHAIGRWDGDTLVVDTVGLNDKTWIDSIGYPHTEALHIVERYRRVKPDELEITFRFEDPKAYTKPWTARTVFALKPDWEISEMVNCENLDMFGEKFFETWHPGGKPTP